MRYVPSRNLLFIHVPKTGGVSVEQVLDAAFETETLPHYWHRLPGRHVTLGHLRQDGDTYPWTVGSFKFCFVRDPVDWYVSLWRWLMDTTRNRRRKNDVLLGAFRGLSWHPKRRLAAIMDGNFNRWARVVCREYPGYLSDLYEQYTDGMDFVGRTESLAADLAALGIPGAVPVANQSHRRRPSVHGRTARMIRQSERRAMERWYE